MAGRLSKKKLSERKNSPAVVRFTEAQTFARLGMEDAAVKTLYAQGITKRLTSARAVAAHDYLYPPVIHYIKVKDYTGDINTTITIKATDDFRVASVEVSIVDGKGLLLEKGAADPYRLKPFIWKYKTTVLNTVVAGTIVNVTAKDYAGNSVKSEWMMGSM